MFKKLRGLLGGLPATRDTAATPGPYPPSSPAHAIYNLLFCDDLSAFHPAPGSEPADWQAALFGPSQDDAKIAALAHDAGAESRVRALAFTWLRAHGHATPRGLVLGVIMEVPMDHGLDVLAAYADGTVRYINHSGRMSVVEAEGLPKANDAAKRLVALAGPLVAQIGPWDKPRPAPPAQPDVRLNFLVSDGLYFGQGDFEVMQRDPMAAPLIQQATELLLLVVNASSGQTGS